MEKENILIPKVMFMKEALKKTLFMDEGSGLVRMVLNIQGIGKWI